MAPTYWAAKSINAAFASGWIKGYEDGTFRPLQNIQRAEVVAIVNRMLNRHADLEFVRAHLNDPEMHTFRDVQDPSYWAYGDIFEATNGHDFERLSDGKSERWERLNGKNFYMHKGASKNPNIDKSQAAGTETAQQEKNGWWRYTKTMEGLKDGKLHVGDVVKFVYRIHNKGQATITNFHVDDPMVKSTDIKWDRTVILPGETATGIYEYRITAEDLVAGKFTPTTRAYVTMDGSELSQSTGLDGLGDEGCFWICP